jgi:hypothetical protein
MVPSHTTLRGTASNKDDFTLFISSFGNHFFQVELEGSVCKKYGQSEDIMRRLLKVSDGEKIIFWISWPDDDDRCRPPLFVYNTTRHVEASYNLPHLVHAK